MESQGNQAGSQEMYLISEQLRQGLIEYLSTRPLREVIDGWIQLKNLKPVSVPKGAGQLTVAKGE